MASPPREHTLFVIVRGTAAATAVTKQVLGFLAKHKERLDEMGVRVQIEQVPAALLGAHPKLVQSFLDKGITEFPCLRTPRKLYLGAKAILTVYAEGIRDFLDWRRSGAAAGRRGEEDFSAESAEDMYRSFYASEMTFAAAQADQGGGDELGDGGGAGMMSKMQEAMRARATRSKTSPAYVSAGQEDADDRAIRDLTSAISAPVSSKTLAQAYAGGGGSDDARDDLLAAAYWANREESM